MNPDALFPYASQLAMLGWVVLAATPYRFAVARTVCIGIGLVLSAMYAALMGSFWGAADGGYDSLASVAGLFANPWLLLAGWVHYLAFDLLLGTWEREEAARIGLSRWLLLPCLGLTFMFGPVGWLLFMGMRYVRQAMVERAATTVPA